MLGENNFRSFPYLTDYILKSVNAS